MAWRDLNLYLDWPHASLDLVEVQRFLNSMGLSAHVKGDFFEANKVDLDEVSAALAGLRIMDINIADSLNREYVNDDVLLEKNILLSSEPLVLEKDFSNIYSGFHLARLLSRYVSSGLHMIFTSRLPATFEGSRYHGRVIILDFPLAIISTTGVVEAPARPREYYVKQMAYHQAKQAGFKAPKETVFMKELKDEFKDRFIGYDDSRMTEVVKGYTLQAIFYLLFGEAFCQSPDCRLFNAHTQEAMIHAQIESSGLCEKHQEMISLVATRH